jgi:hypothetical protein
MHIMPRTAQPWLIEYDPLYCATIIPRWAAFTGKVPTLAGDGKSLEPVGDLGSASAISQATA